jgi:membrane dipeptidase
MPDLSVSRRDLLAGAAVAALAPSLPALAQAAKTLGLPLSESQMEDGARLLRTTPSVDMHAHPGRFFGEGYPAPTPLMKLSGPIQTETAVQAMASGHVSAAVFSGVADMALLELNLKTGALFAGRGYAPGEAWADYQRQVALLKGLVRRRLARRGETRADVEAALKAGGAPACIFGVEGGDFIEDRPERVAAAHADGVRVITLVHYAVNALGDPQTSAPVHNGLTPLGRSVVKAMNRAGVLIDVAHASLETTRGVVEASSAPVMLSHSNLARPGADNPRLISREHAALVARAGGVVGSVPSGIGQASMSDWIDSILRLADAVGPGHVGVGTDMDANYRPVFTSYAQWSLIPAALLARGLAPVEVAAVMGGNFLRIFPGRG